jgi:ribonuclease-3
VQQAERLADRLGLPISDRGLLGQALTHASWLHEHPGEAPGHNERLEYLGDAVINLAISEALYGRHPEDDEGVLSARRAAIVSAAGLAGLAERIELGQYLRLGEGEAPHEGPFRPGLLASTFEALAGALLLDIGWPATRDWLVALAAPELDAETPPAELKSPKSRLQEFVQQRLAIRPVYRVVEAAGPDHEKVFRVEVDVDREMLGMGIGPSRRLAETAAAAEAIAVLEARRADDEAAETGDEGAEADDKVAEAGDPAARVGGGA